MVSVSSEGSGSVLFVYWAGYLLNLVAKLPCAALLRLAWFGLGSVWFGISTAPRPELPDSYIRVKGSRLPPIRLLTPKSITKNSNSLKHSRLAFFDGSDDARNLILSQGGIG